MQRIKDFWTRQDLWPADPEGFTFLGRAVHDLGKKLFPHDWSGQEPYIGALSPGQAEARYKKSLEDAKRELTRANAGLSNILSPNLPPDYHSNLQKIRERAEARLRRLQECPAFSRSEAESRYVAAAPAVERYDSVVEQLKFDLQSGTKRAELQGVGGGQLSQVAPELWSSIDLKQCVATGQLSSEQSRTIGLIGPKWIFLTEFSNDQSVDEPRRATKQKGDGSFSGVDAPILAEMKQMIEQGEAASAQEAARKLASKAHGDGTLESKQTRLAKRYMSQFGRAPANTR
jgi:hypothetical protein